MLLGMPGVKAGTSTINLINNALASDSWGATDSDEPRGHVTDAYNRMKMSETLTHFEHAIWL